MASRWGSPKKPTGRHGARSATSRRWRQVPALGAAQPERQAPQHRADGVALGRLRLDADQRVPDARGDAEHADGDRERPAALDTGRPAARRAARPGRRTPRPRPRGTRTATPSVQRSPPSEPVEQERGRPAVLAGRPAPAPRSTATPARRPPRALRAGCARTRALPTGDGELEAGEVVAGHGEQHVGPALELDQVGVGDDDQQRSATARSSDRDVDGHGRAGGGAPRSRASWVGRRAAATPGGSEPRRSPSRVDTSTYDSESPPRSTKLSAMVASGSAEEHGVQVAHRVGGDRAVEARGSSAGSSAGVSGERRVVGLAGRGDAAGVEPATHVHARDRQPGRPRRPRSAARARRCAAGRRTRTGGRRRRPPWRGMPRSASPASTRSRSIRSPNTFACRFEPADDLPQAVVAQRAEVAGAQLAELRRRARGRRGRRRSPSSRSARSRRARRRRARRRPEPAPAAGRRRGSARRSRRVRDAASSGGR